LLTNFPTDLQADSHDGRPLLSGPQRLAFPEVVDGICKCWLAHAAHDVPARVLDAWICAKNFLGSG
jgi:hypothetical protein